MLVILVVFAFLRSTWATIIPGIAVPVSLLGTFGAMYLLGYTLDNLSLMALTVSTGFVVDDAIVVIENITRYLEQGWTPMKAALQGAKEIGFTVLSMSTSLVAVFIPILLMGGIVGRLFREFAITLTIAITISLAVSLTTTPMMCARFLRSERGKRHNFMYRVSESAFNGIHGAYARTLASGFEAPAIDVSDYARNARGQRVLVHHRSEGILSAAGYGTDRRKHRSRSRHIVRRHAAEAARVFEDCRSGSGD